MEKKLTAQGPKSRKSYTVTLPIEWIKQEGLDKTKSVTLDIVGQKAIISSHHEILQKSVISAGHYEKNIIKVLQGLYRIGVNEIKFTDISPKIVEDITDIIEKKLIGYEVVEHKKEYIIVKDITKESEEDFKVIFRRIFLLLLELSESDDLALAKTIGKNIKKFINYCQRILMKKGHSDFRKTPIYYLILDRLEKISDEFQWLLEIAIPKKEADEFIKEASQILREAYGLFYKFDVKKYNTYQYQTYVIKNNIKFGQKVDKATIHHHNIARLLNSLYADIFTLKYDEADD